MPEVRYCPYCGRSLAGVSPDADCIGSFAYNFYYCASCPANGGRSLKFSEPDCRKVDYDEA